MSNIHRIEQAEALMSDAAASGNVLGHQLGARFPHFTGCSRELLAQVFEGNSFPRAAKEARTIKPESALTEAVNRAGANLCAAHAGKVNGSSVEYALTKLAKAGDHAKTWGVLRKVIHEGERAPDHAIGARVFVSPAGIFAADPVAGDGQPIPECRQIAEALASHALWLLVNAETADVSRALTKAYEESGALPYISRGGYLAVAGRSGSARIVACVNEIKAKFYNDATRTGIRASAIAVTEQDEDSVTDALADDLEDRARALVESLKGEHGRSNVRPSTLQSRLDSCRAVLNDLAPVAGRIGGLHDRIRKVVESVSATYQAQIDGVTLDLPDWFDAELPGDASVVPVAPVEPPAQSPEAEPVSGPGVVDAAAPVADDSDLEAFSL